MMQAQEAVSRIKVKTRGPGSVEHWSDATVKSVCEAQSDLVPQSIVFHVFCPVALFIYNLYNVLAH